MQAGTTGLRTWTAALHCAHHFLSSPDALFGRPTRAVLELGAGTGFLSAVLAHEGVGVIATDLGDDDCEGEEDAGGLTSGDVDGGIQEGARATPLGRLRANLSNSEIPFPTAFADSRRPSRARAPA